MLKQLLDALNNVSKKILPWAMLLFTVLTVINLIIALINSQINFALYNLGYLTGIWGLLFLALWDGCKRDMSGVTEQQVNLYKQLGLTLTGVTFLIGVIMI